MKDIGSILSGCIYKSPRFIVRRFRGGLSNILSAPSHAPPLKIASPILIDTAGVLFVFTTNELLYWGHIFITFVGYFKTQINNIW